MTQLVFPEDLVDEHEDKFDDVIIQRARQILRTWDGMSGKAPSVVAAAAVYAASITTDSEEWTQKEIVDIFGASEASIRKYYRDAFRVWREDHAGGV